MAITVEFTVYGEAVLDNKQWSHPDEQVKRLLNSWVPLIHLSGSDPYPALTVAEEIAQKVGGKVVKADPIRPKANAIY